jgi:hypothetical protein
MYVTVLFVVGAVCGCCMHACCDTGLLTGQAVALTKEHAMLKQWNAAGMLL